jgi:hypothetical protein
MKYCVFSKLHSALAKQHLERLQKSLFETEKSKFVQECKQISALQIISFVVVPCHVKIFLNFPFFTVQLFSGLKNPFKEIHETRKPEFFRE